MVSLNSALPKGAATTIGGRRPDQTVPRRLFSPDESEVSEGSSPLASAAGWRWEPLDLEGPEAVAAARRLARRICAEDSRATLDHDLTWLIDGGIGQGSRLSAFVCRQGDDVVGFVPIRQAAAKLTLRVGHLGLLPVATERVSIIGCPLFAQKARGCEAELTALLLRELAGRLPPRAVIFAYGVRSDAALFDLMGQRRLDARGFHIVPQGPIYQRRFIRRTAGYDAYIAGLGPKTRENLRRQQRRLQAACGGGVTLRRYTSPADLEPFLEAATAVSRLTYQWRIYGSGLSNRAVIETRLQIAARNGWFCSYVLFNGDRPLAFMMGLRHGISYRSQEIGYDPEWRHYSVGNVLHCLVVKDLFETFGDVQEFDFLFGDGTHKRQLSNASRDEGNFYVIPNTLWGWIASAVVRLDNAATRLNAAFEGSRLKTRIRQLLRHRATRREEDGRADPPAAGMQALKTGVAPQSPE